MINMLDYNIETVLQGALSKAISLSLYSSFKRRSLIITVAEKLTN